MTGIPEYLDLKVSLIGVKPRIWRRFLLPSGSRFYDLHQAIQIACGWKDYHLFSFSAPGSDIGRLPLAGIPSDQDLDMYDRKVPDARRVKLVSALGRGKLAECVYLYDFGDDWRHKVEVKGELELPEVFHRRLIGGERAFPPEDCGGISGYERMLRVVHEGKADAGENLIETMEWLGKWDPDRCDLDDLRSRFDK